MNPVLIALLFVPALVAIAVVLLRRPPRVLDAAAPAQPTISGAPSPIATLDSLLTELEGTALDGRAVAELERLADRLEAAAASLERVG